MRNTPRPGGSIFNWRQQKSPRGFAPFLQGPLRSSSPEVGAGRRRDSSLRCATRTDVDHAAHIAKSRSEWREKYGGVVVPSQSWRPISRRAQLLVCSNAARNLAVSRHRFSYAEVSGRCWDGSGRPLRAANRGDGSQFRSRVSLNFLLNKSALYSV